jgi:hypothetical protein
MMRDCSTAELTISDIVGEIILSDITAVGSLEPNTVSYGLSTRVFKEYAGENILVAINNGSMSVTSDCDQSITLIVYFVCAESVWTCLAFCIHTMFDGVVDRCLDCIHTGC